MMNSKNCVIKLRVKDLTIYALIWVRSEMKVKIVLSMKEKQHIMNVFTKVKLLKKINVVSN